MTDYGWFLTADPVWEPITGSGFTPKGHKSKLKFVVLEQYQDAYDVTPDEAANRLRGILALNTESGLVYRHPYGSWFHLATDMHGVEHKFLIEDTTGTVAYYSPPSWEARMGIPVPVGPTVPVEAFRDIDTSQITATRNTLKRTYGRLERELAGTRTIVKMEHMRKSLAGILSDPATQVLYNADNPQAYIVKEGGREVVWIVRTDGRYVFRIFSRETNEKIYENVLRF